MLKTTLILTLIMCLGGAEDTLPAPKVLNMTDFVKHFQNIYVRNTEGDIIPLLTLQNYSVVDPQVMAENPSLHILNSVCQLAILLLSTLCSIQIVMCRNALRDALSHFMRLSPSGQV